MRQSPAGSVFLPFGFVLAHLQVFFNLRIRQRPMIGTARQKAKIHLPHRYIISINALASGVMARNFMANSLFDLRT